MFPEKFLQPPTGTTLGWRGWPWEAPGPMFTSTTADRRREMETEGRSLWATQISRALRARWMVDFMENPNEKWMRTFGGTPMTKRKPPYHQPKSGLEVKTNRHGNVTHQNGCSTKKFGHLTANKWDLDGDTWDYQTEMNFNKATLKFLQSGDRIWPTKWYIVVPTDIWNQTNTVGW